MALRCCFISSLLLLYLFSSSAQLVCNFTVSTQGSPQCYPFGTCQSLVSVLQTASGVGCINVTIVVAPNTYTTSGFVGIIVDNYVNNSNPISFLHINSTGATFDAGGDTFILNSSLINHISFDGITFQNGYNDVGTGGCVSVTTPVNGFAGFFNSVFQNCNVLSIGGGLYVQSQGAARLHTVNFFSNNATSGGGLYAFANQGQIFVENCLFGMNTATVHGGGAHVRGDSPGNVVFNISTFQLNQATNGGGLALDYGGQYTSLFFSNNTASNGGAIYTYTGNDPVSPPIVFNTPITITMNAAAYGGGMYILNPNTIVNSANIRMNAAGNGSGIYLNTLDMSNASSCSLQLNDVYVHDNVAEFYGGGLYCSASCASMPQTKFYNNNAGSENVNGSWVNDVYCDGTCASAFCSACNCNTTCDSCVNGCANQDEPGKQNYCYCYVPSYELTPACYDESDDHHSNKSRRIALGLVFGLVLPLILLGAVVGFLIARERKKRLGFAGLDEMDPLMKQRYGST